eukprot:TRINITY_DN80555_c0_g1_i1.p1 TRINITY_DN80555_c0_g1~~TRINITY_DN80555_c0_g1_i1.p1  ORF type:complete len:151 (+),score=48.52 TRINITY_DN80555_c0_g1_i1:87-539(+)
MAPKLGAGRKVGVAMAADLKVRKEKGKKVPKVGKAGKASKKPKQPDAPRRSHKRKAHAKVYNSYIYKVLKQVHPECLISKKGMNIMNSFMNDIFDRMATESTRLLRTMQKKTLTGREVQTSVRLLLPGELAKHAVSEGTKAVNKYIENSA